MITQPELTAELASALQSFAAIEREIVMLGAQADADKAHRLVQLRRQLVLEFARVRDALEAEPSMLCSPELMTAAMRQLAAFRTSNAINQADWPVVRVRDNPAEYRVASRSVGEASRLFWGWTEQHLGFRAEL